MNVGEGSYPKQRSAPRFEMRIPLKLKFMGEWLPGFTRDVSTSGVCFYVQLNHVADVGGNIEFIITLPPEVTKSTSLHLQCEGTVVRTDYSEFMGQSIAAKIHHYTFLEAAEA